jgi:hypothetical protein
MLPGRCHWRTAVPSHSRHLRLRRSRSHWLPSLRGDVATRGPMLLGFSQTPARTGRAIPTIETTTVPNIIITSLRHCVTSSNSYRSRVRDYYAHVLVNASVEIEIHSWLVIEAVVLGPSPAIPPKGQRRRRALRWSLFAGTGRRRQ